MVSFKIIRIFLLALALGATSIVAMNNTQQTAQPNGGWTSLAAWKTWGAKVSGLNLAKRTWQRGKDSCTARYNQTKDAVQRHYQGTKEAINALPQAARTVIQENRDSISLATGAATIAYLQPDLALSVAMAAVAAAGMNYISANTISTIANGALVGIVNFSSGSPLTAGVVGAAGAILSQLNNDRLAIAAQEVNTQALQLAQQAQQTVIATRESLQRNWDALPEQIRLNRDPITLGATGLAAVYLFPVALRLGIDAAISSCTGIVIHQITSGSELKKLITSAAGSTATFLVLFFGTNVGASVIDTTSIVLAGGALGTICALHPDRAQHALEQAGTHTGNAIRVTKEFLVRHRIDVLLALGGLGTIYALLRLARQLVTNVNAANTVMCVFEISFNHFEGQNPNPIRSTMSLTDKGQLIPSANCDADLMALATMLNSDNSEQGTNVYLPIQSENRAIRAVCFIKIHREHTPDDRLRFTISVVRRFDDNSESVMSAAEHENDPLITLNATLLSSAGEHKQLTTSEAERRMLSTIIEVEKDRSFRERVNAQ